MVAVDNRKCKDIGNHRREALGLAIELSCLYELSVQLSQLEARKICVHLKAKS